MISEKWRKLFGELPGYDPVATAGDCTFDEVVAERVVEFFPSCLTHIEGELAGKPFVLEPWQQAIIGCAFGWKRPNGLRRYREVFQYVPRKNGKSTQLGGLINLVAFCDNEPGAQIYSAAAEREQAALVYRQAKGMILNNPDLEAETKIYATFKSIEYPGGVVYKALSADADTKHGFNTHFVVVDELHAQPNRDLVDVLVTSTGSRRQPLVWYITTADFGRESICNEKHDYACKVRDGIIDDPAFLPVVFEASLNDDWTSPAIWHKANPNLGISVSEEYLARECQRAKDSPAYENTFKRLHLNIKTEQDVRWLPIDKWENAEVIDADSLVGRTCYAGLDLASTRDLTAFVLMFPLEDGNYAILPHFWLPEDAAAQRARRDRVPYDVWVKQGWIKTTEGDATDYQQVRADIDALGQKYGIRKIAVDRLFQGEETCHRLSDMGFDVEAFGQGFFSMAAPTKRFDELYHAGKFKHDGNPVMRWMIGNASVEFDSAKNMKPSKKKSTEKIDGVVSACMALGLCMANEGEPTGPLFYSG